jgi:hypothetical protein
MHWRVNRIARRAGGCECRDGIQFREGYNSSARGWRFTLFCESRTERILYTTRRMLGRTPSKAVSL